MTQVTTILGKQVGVQFQGTQDKTNFPSLNRQTQLLMLLDGVGRGRLDKMMVVTDDSLKAQLGSERDNLQLQAVQDSLLTGVPSVLVMRCFTEKERVAVRPVIQPSAGSRLYEVMIDDDIVATLTLDELKQGFRRDGVSVRWESSTQQFVVSGDV